MPRSDGTTDVAIRAKNLTLARMNLFANDSDSDANKDGLHAAVFLLTPLGLASSWRCAPSAWQSAVAQADGSRNGALRDLAGAIDERVLSQACLKPLLDDARDLSNDLAQGVNYLSLTPEEQNIFPRGVGMLAASAFENDDTSTTKSSYTIQFVHRFMRTQMADACIWSFSDCQRNAPWQNSRWLEMAVEDSQAGVSQKLIECRERCRDWRKIIHSFREAWVEYQGALEEGAQLTSLPDQSGALSGFKLDSSIGQKLNRRKRENNAGSGVLSVYANLCDAAMGVYATLVHLQYASNKGANNAENRSKLYNESIRVGMSALYPSETFAGVSDLNFCKSIYVALTTSPVVLLSPMRFAATKSKTVESSYTLKSFASVLKWRQCSESAPEDRVERAIFRVIFRIALQGPERINDYVRHEICILEEALAGGVPIGLTPSALSVEASSDRIAQDNALFGLGELVTARFSKVSIPARRRGKVIDLTRAVTDSDFLKSLEDLDAGYWERLGTEKAPKSESARITPTPEQPVQVGASEPHVEQTAEQTPVEKAFSQNCDTEGADGVEEGELPAEPTLEVDEEMEEGEVPDHDRSSTEPSGVILPREAPLFLPELGNTVDHDEIMGNCNTDEAMIGVPGESESEESSESSENEESSEPGEPSEAERSAEPEALSETESSADRAAPRDTEDPAEHGGTETNGASSEEHDSSETESNLADDAGESNQLRKVVLRVPVWRRSNRTKNTNNTSSACKSNGSRSTKSRPGRKRQPREADESSNSPPSKRPRTETAPVQEELSESVFQPSSAPSGGGRDTRSYIFGTQRLKTKKKKLAECGERFRVTVQLQDYEILTAGCPDSIDPLSKVMTVWRNEVLEVELFEGMQGRYDDFKTLAKERFLSQDQLPNTRCSDYVEFCKEDDRHSRRILTLPGVVWNSLHTSRRRELAARHTVVLRGGDDAILPDVDSFHSASLRTVFPFHAPRQALLQSIHSPKVGGSVHVRTTLHEFAETTRVRDCVLNVLDIPAYPHRVGQLPVGELDDGCQLFDAESTFFSWETKPPMGVTKWAIAGHAKSYSPPHMDAGGLYTYIKFVTGEKFWFIGHQVSGEGEPFEWGNGPWEGLAWECVRVRRGDQLIMPPCTPHFVITTDDCLAVGGHFYNYEGVFDTMRAIVVEHYFGDAWTNTDHPSAYIILFKMADELLFRMRAKRMGRPTRDVPSARISGGLMILVLHIDQLSSRPNGSPYKQWVGTPEFESDFGQVKDVAVELLREWMLVELQCLKNGEVLREEDTIQPNLLYAEDVLLQVVRDCIASMSPDDKKDVHLHGKFELRRLSCAKLPKKPYFRDEE